jgi:peroxiredoxin
LPDLDGTQRSLASFRGKRVLLVFSEPDCEPCQTLAPRLVELDQSGQENNLAVLMVSRGDPDANRAQAKQHGYAFPVLLQQSWEVSRQYGALAAPVGYLIDERGAVAAEMAVGPEAIRKLV